MIKDDYANVFKPIGEPEVEDWASSARSPSARLFRQFLDSDDEMVEVNLDSFPFVEHKNKRVKTSKQVAFASAFYSWKRQHKQTLLASGKDIVLIRRGEKVALRKKDL